MRRVDEKMKKIAIAFSLVFVIACGFIISGITSKANSANISVTVDESEIKKGQEFTVRVAISSDTAMASIDSFVSYNSELLEYVPCDDDALAGASGVVHIMDTFDEGSQLAEYELTFKALEVGESDIDLYDTYIEELENLNFLEAATTKATINITEDDSQSEEARLSDLLVDPGELNTDFDPNTFEYSVDVAEEDEMIALSAIPMEEDSVVTIEKEETLAMGANTVKIIVTSPSGYENTYTLTVNRGALPAEETSETEVQDETDMTETDETSKTEGIPETEESVETEETIESQAKELSQ